MQIWGAADHCSSQAELSPLPMSSVLLCRCQGFCMGKYCLCSRECHVCNIKRLPIVALAVFHHALEKNMLVCCDLFTANASQYLLTSPCSFSQYFVLKAVVFLRQLHSSRSQRNFSHLLPLALFPINMIKWCSFKTHLRHER